MIALVSGLLLVKLSCVLLREAKIILEADYQLAVFYCIFYRRIELQN